MHEKGEKHHLGGSIGNITEQQKKSSADSKKGRSNVKSGPLLNSAFCWMQDAGHFVMATCTSIPSFMLSTMSE